ncbi:MULTISPECIES: Abi family protein [Bacillaceae]
MLSLYEFDRRLRLLLLGALEKIEIAFRTHFSYEDFLKNHLLTG